MKFSSSAVSQGGFPALPAGRGWSASSSPAYLVECISKKYIYCVHCKKLDSTEKQKYIKIHIILCSQMIAAIRS